MKHGVISLNLRPFLKALILFLCGGAIYYCLEILGRGYSHGSMFILGGICFLLLGAINEFLPWNMGLVWQSLLGAVMITVLEFFTGLIVNVWLGLGVWDYSDLPFNLLGQICLPFSLLWVLLSAFGILLDDHLRHFFFGEEPPRYTLF